MRSEERQALGWEDGAGVGGHGVRCGRPVVATDRLTHCMDS